MEVGRQREMDGWKGSGMEVGWQRERLMGGTGADGWEFSSPWGKPIADCAHDKLRHFLHGVWFVLPWVICLYFGFGLDGPLMRGFFYSSERGRRQPE